MPECMHFPWPWDNSPWPVLIYMENEERLLDNFLGTVHLVMWMAEPDVWFMLDG